jgi:RNA polymerase sigma-70 factor (ECF subfamily)
MRQMVENLPDTYREALILSDLEGISQKQVAERLGVGLSGAKSRIQRGREKLRGLVQSCCHLELDAYGNALEHVCRTPGV